MITRSVLLSVVFGSVVFRGSAFLLVFALIVVFIAALVVLIILIVLTVLVLCFLFRHYIVRPFGFIDRILSITIIFIGTENIPTSFKAQYSRQTRAQASAFYRLLPALF